MGPLAAGMPSREAVMASCAGVALIYSFAEECIEPAAGCCAGVAAEGSSLDKNCIEPAKSAIKMAASEAEATKSIKDIMKVSDFHCTTLYLLLKMSPDLRFVLWAENNTSLQGVVMASASRETIFVVFRGSQELSDFLTDAQFLKTDMDGDIDITCGSCTTDKILVHRGFWKQLITGTAEQDLMRAVEAEISANPTFVIKVSGHSLGGGLATLFSYQCAVKFPEKQVVCVTFGSPRVGNKAFVEKYHALSNLQHWRFQVDRDLVTRVPAFGYLHCGVHCWLKGEELLCAEKTAFMASIPAFCDMCCCQGTIITSVLHHDLTRYFNKIKTVRWPTVA